MITQQTKNHSFGATQMNENLAGKSDLTGLLSIKTANSWIEESIKRPDPKFYFNNLIVQYENTVIFSASNVGKSILAVQIAEDIAKTEKVLYVDLELSTKQFQMRYYDVSTGKAHLFPANFSRAEITPEFMVRTDLSQEILDSIECVAQQGTKFFVIDNITFICNDTERGKKAGDFMLKLIHLKKKYDLTTIVIAHTPKRRGWKPITQNDLAGSSKLINFFDAGIALALSSNDSGLRYLKQVKVRTGEFIYGADNVLILDINKDDGYLKFDLLGCGCEEDHLNTIKENAMADDIITLLKLQQEGLTIREIAEVMNIGKSTVQRRLDRAKKSQITIPNESKDCCPTSGTVGQGTTQNN